MEVGGQKSDFRSRKLEVGWRSLSGVEATFY